MIGEPLLANHGTDRRRRRLWPVLALVLALAAIVASASWWFNRDPLDDLADPSSVELPAQPTDPTATLTYLQGPGAPLVAAVRSTEWPADATDQATCKAIATQLDTVGTPAALLDIANAIPDIATADMAQSFVGAAVSFLDTCLGEPPADSSADDVLFAKEILDRRFDQLGL